MKYLLQSTFVVSFFYFFTPQVTAQTHKITPAIAAKIQARVDSAAQVFKINFKENNGDNLGDAEFALDTFKIEQATEYAFAFDRSTMGMNATVNKATANYDSLMNKYYKKLLARLQGDDKQTLINAQREWLKLKEFEINLIGTISHPKYSGGGSIQSNINIATINEMVKHRASTIYGYYARTTEQ